MTSYDGDSYMELVGDWTAGLFSCTLWNVCNPLSISRNWNLSVSMLMSYDGDSCTWNWWELELSGKLEHWCDHIESKLNRNLWGWHMHLLGLNCWVADDKLRWWLLHGVGGRLNCRVVFVHSLECATSISWNCFWRLWLVDHNITRRFASNQLNFVQKYFPVSIQLE